MKKIILVTGASSGMGKDSAIRLVKEGHRVYAVARRTEAMKDLEALGARVLKMDVSDAQDIKSVVELIIQAEGRIDVLWNNAGYGLYGPVELVALEEARKQFEVNLFGLAALTQRVIPHMRKAGSGTIINTSSMGGKMYTPLGAWYHASKHALEGWSDCLRLELKAFNINVVILEPGIIATSFGEVLSEKMPKESERGVYKGIIEALLKANRRSYEKKGQSSPTSVIANTVAEIVKSDHPKTRYRVGKWARLMVGIRLFLGDRIFDRLVMSQL